MSTVVRLCVPVCALLVLTAAPLTAAPFSAPGYQAGAAKVEITPEESIRLSGYGSRQTVSEGVDQPLFARALVLKDPAGILSVIVSIDAIGIPAHMRERICSAIRGPLGIYRVRVAVGATHTHYAPCLSGTIVNLNEMTPAESRQVEAYTRSVTRRAVEAVQTAVERLRRVKLVYGAGTAGFAANRRTPGGPVDRRLPVLAAVGDDGQPVAIVFNYACHATTIPAARNRVCGDWPGYGAEYLDATYPGAVTLPLIGCGADANPTPRGKQAQAQAYGREIATAVEGVLKRTDLTPITKPVDAQFEYVDLRFHRLPTEDELRARLTRPEAHIRRHARLLLDEIEREGSLSETYRYPVQVWSFADQLTMVFLAGEVVVDYALRLDRELPSKRLWVTSYANDLPGYIASRRVLGEGGYEADGSMIWYGRPGRWHASVEDTIVEEVKELVARAGSLRARIKPPPALSPREALKSMRLLDGLEVELVASEPQVVDPVAIAFDAGGALYACEMRDYPLGPGPGQPPDGRIRRLEDLDADGHYEHSTVFAPNVPYPNGIACWKGGVFVTALTDILYLKDTTGDGRADVRQVTYTGFAPGNSQHLVNTVEWGLDNRFYVLGGDRADITSPANPAFEKVLLRWSSLRFDPQTLNLEPTSGYHGGYGIALTPDGRRIICSSTNHARLVVLERRYLERNPDLRVSGVTQDMARERPRLYPATRPLERFNDPFDEGHFSAACGVHVYLGNRLPDAFHGNLFAAEPVSNLVHHDRLVSRGATLETRRVEARREFMASTDYWFRPVNITTGPDGALYIVDMYREVIEHPEWIPEHVQKLFDLRSGMDRGRIYRVRSAAVTTSGREASVAMAAASTDQVVREIAHENEWRRKTARRILIERRDTSAAPRLRALAREAPSPLARLAALWTLDGLSAHEPTLLTPSDLSTALADPEPGVRVNGAILAERWLARAGAAGDPRDVSRVMDALLKLADDPSPRVRFQAALSLGSLPEERRRDPLIRIALRDAADSWVRTAILASWPGSPTPLMTRLVREGLSPAGRGELLGEAADLIGTRGRRTEQVDGLLLVLGGEEDSRGGEPQRMAALARLLERLGTREVARLLEGEDPEATRLRAGLRRVVAESALRVRDASLDLGDRLRAMRLLVYEGSPRLVSLFSEFLSSQYPRELQLAAVEGLGRLSGDLYAEATTVLIERYSNLTPPVRAGILEECLQDPKRAKRFLSALEEGLVLASEVDLPSRARFLEFPDTDLRARATKIFEVPTQAGNRAALVERYRQAFAARLVKDASLERGRQLFVDNCSTCHRVGDLGHSVGPDLVGLDAKTADALLIDVLDPNRAVEGRYTGYTIVTRDGLVHTGLMVAETPNTLVLRREGGETDTILRRDVLDLRSTGLSVMPVGLEEELDPEKMYDLVAFLRRGLAELGGN